MIEGLLIVDKPARMSSARAVALVKRLLGGATKVGHAGTLDPFATGVLVLLIGRATRACERVMSWPKTYEATVKLGATTVTDDPESQEQNLLDPGTKVPGPSHVQNAVRDFVGLIEQRPPVYSAIKIAGRRACDRARAGTSDIEMKPRRVRVDRIDLLEYEWPFVRLRIDCGRGTYIRSIGRDLGEKLGVGGYLTALRRTRVGPCTIERAARIEELDQDRILRGIIPVPADDDAAKGA